MRWQWKPLRGIPMLLPLRPQTFLKHFIICKLLLDHLIFVALSDDCFVPFISFHVIFTPFNAFLQTLPALFQLLLYIFISEL